MCFWFQVGIEDENDGAFYYYFLFADELVNETKNEEKKKHLLSDLYDVQCLVSSHLGIHFGEGHKGFDTGIILMLREMFMIELKNREVAAKSQAMKDFAKLREEMRGEDGGASGSGGEESGIGGGGSSKSKILSSSKSRVGSSKSRDRGGASGNRSASGSPSSPFSSSGVCCDALGVSLARAVIECIVYYVMYIM